MATTGGAGGTAGTMGTGGGTSTDGAVPADLKAIATQVASVFCDAYTKCLGPVVDAAFNRASCPFFEEHVLLNDEFSLLENAFARGTVQDTRSELPACLASVSTASCSKLFSRNLCPDVFPGTVTDGQPCVFNGECSNGLFCKTGATCPGTCTALLPSGASCAHTSDCQDGLACSPSGTCQAQTIPDLTGAAGDPCDLAGLKLCGSGLACALVSVAGGTPAYRCEAPLTGGSCHLAIPEECPAHQYCSLASGLLGTCTPEPLAGEPCGKPSSNSKPSACDTDAVCDAGSATCMTVGENGEPCTADNECYSQHCVKSKCAASTCPPPSP